MSSGFKDHFSGIAASYAAHRPTYPAALIEFLARATPRHEVAWDCGCGSGQLSVALASRFGRVIATDASAQQIAAAEPHAGVEYRCAPAEACGLEDRSVDLAVSAQAAHWFDLPAYYAEVRRVARPGAVLALATYGNPLAGVARIDEVVDSFYSGPCGPHWPPERRHTEDGYRSFEFPFEEIEAPPLELRVEWDLAGFLGYVETWSAVRALVKAEGRKRLEAFRRELGHAWGAEETVRAIRWPLTVRAGKI